MAPMRGGFTRSTRPKRYDAHELVCKSIYFLSKKLNLTRAIVLQSLLTSFFQWECDPRSFKVKPLVRQAWLNDVEDSLIYEDLNRRKKVCDEITSIQLSLVAKEVEKGEASKRRSWPLAELARPPPSTPTNPLT